MKIRTGFVSNSSSSSFTCSVCGETYSGMDTSPSDFEMFECKNGHYICDEHKIELTDKQKEKILKQEAPDIEGEDLDEKWDNFIDDCCGESPIEECPICQLKEFDNADLATYFYKSRNLTKQSLSEEVKSKFKSYSEFRDYLK